VGRPGHQRVVKVETVQLRHEKVTHDRRNGRVGRQSLQSIPS
jgi:hypothetical protein